MTDTEIKWNRIRDGLLWILLPLALGLLAASAIPQPRIGLIRLEDAIYPYSGRDLIAQIRYASEQAEIRAVVLALDSPGGTVVDTEAVYMELTRLRARKPVVTAVNGMAASGAYYLAVNTDYIFAKPTSLVGNVGVIGYLPPSPFIYEDIISTGPYKLWGAPRDADMREIDTVKQGFFEAVTLGRGDRLKLSPGELLSGEIWTGFEGLDLGVVDALGTETDAVEMAADLAHVANYETVDLRLPAAGTAYPQTFFLETTEGLILPYPRKPGTYLLFIPQLPVAE